MNSGNFLDACPIDFLKQLATTTYPGSEMISYEQSQQFDKDQFLKDISKSDELEESESLSQSKSKYEIPAKDIKMLLDQCNSNSSTDGSTPQKNKASSELNINYKPHQTNNRQEDSSDYMLIEETETKSQEKETLPKEENVVEKLNSDLPMNPINSLNICPHDQLQTTTYPGSEMISYKDQFFKDISKSDQLEESCPLSQAQAKSTDEILVEDAKMLLDQHNSNSSTDDSDSALLKNNVTSQLNMNFKAQQTNNKQEDRSDYMLIEVMETKSQESESFTQEEKVMNELKFDLPPINVQNYLDIINYEMLMLWGQRNSSVSTSDANFTPPKYKMGSCLDINNKPKYSEKIKTNERKTQKKKASNKQEGKAETPQSIYKNKYKELLEKAMRIKSEMFNLSLDEFENVRNELEKSDKDWEREGDQLRECLKLFEDEENFKLQLEHEELKKEKEEKKPPKKGRKSKTQASTSKTSEDSKKNPQTDLMNSLRRKKYCLFTDLWSLKADIQRNLTENGASHYFKEFKKTRGNKYFKKVSEEEELFHWIILVRIVLRLIPSQKENLKLLPLRKDTVAFMFWMIESDSMTIQNKNLFKEFKVRSHLIKKFNEIYDRLINKAKESIENGKLSEKFMSLNKILKVLGDGSNPFDVRNESPNPHLISNCSTISGTEDRIGKRGFEQLDNLDLSEDDCSSPRFEKKIFS